jgi:glutaredoxin 3
MKSCSYVFAVLIPGSDNIIEKDVDLDEEALKEMMYMNISGVPAFLIGDEVVIGLDEEEILELVKQ